MNQFKITLLSGVLTCAIVAGCESDTISTANNNEFGQTSVFITDAITDDFEKIWVSIEQISLIDAEGGEFVIQSAEDAEIYNLAKYNNIGKLVGTFDAPSGDYEFIRVTLENSVSLMDEDENTVSATFATEGESFSIDVPAELTVRPNGREALAVDFDLEQFEYDAETGLVTPVLVYKNRDDVADIDEVTAEVSGWVTEIIDANSFEFQTKEKFGGQELLVTLVDASLVVDDNSDAQTNDTSLLMVGDKVEVEGNYDPEQLVIEAIEVEFERAEDDGHDDDDDEIAKVEGVISTYDGETLIVDVIEAEEFVPPTSTLEITDFMNARFVRGTLAMLTEGQEIKVKGEWVDELFIASQIKIEGAPPAGNAYAKLEGDVIAINGDMVDVLVDELKYGSNELEDVTLTIDFSGAFFQKGDAECVIVGAEIEAKGSFDGVTYAPFKVEVDDCDDDSDEDEDEDDDSEDDDVEDDSEEDESDDDNDDELDD